jgi:hypothetical protein
VTALQLVLTALAAVALVWLVVLILLDRLPGPWLYGALLVLEAGLVAQLVLGIVRLSGGHAGVNVAAYLGYLIGSLLILPAAVLWSLGERTRAGTGVLIVAVVVVPVLFLRLHQLWTVR